MASLLQLPATVLTRPGASRPLCLLGFGEGSGSTSLRPYSACSRQQRFMSGLWDQIASIARRSSMTCGRHVRFPATSCICIGTANGDFGDLSIDRTEPSSFRWIAGISDIADFEESHLKYMRPGKHPGRYLLRSDTSRVFNSDRYGTSRNLTLVPP